jgi:hypothetical protein
MTRWLWLLLLMSGLALAQLVVPSTVKTATITGLCEGTTWKAYRTKDLNLWVGCGDAVPPAGSVELRAYYVLPSGGPKR